MRQGRRTRCWRTSASSPPGPGDRRRRRLRLRPAGAGAGPDVPALRRQRHVASTRRGRVRLGGTPRSGRRTTSRTPRAATVALPYHGRRGQDQRGLVVGARRARARAARAYYVENATRYHTTQVFAGGAHRHADLFAPFEDWRVGTGGWGPLGFARWDGTANATGAVRGAHVAPMRLKRLGAPPVRTVDPWGWCHERQACSAVKFNGGLVLNRARPRGTSRSRRSSSRTSGTTSPGSRAGARRRSWTRTARGRAST